MKEKEILTKEKVLELITNNYTDVKNLIYSIVNDEYHEVWIFAKDFATKELKVKQNWNWLSNLVFDLNSLIKDNIVKLLKNYPIPIKKGKKYYYFNLVNPGLFGYSELTGKDTKLVKACKNNNVKEFVEWLFERYKSVAENLFDKRSKKSLKVNIINFNELEELISSSLYRIA